MNSGLTKIAAVLAAVAAWSATPVLADGVNISPLRVTLAPPSRSAVFMLTNSTMARLDFHAHVYRWTQDGANDMLTPTSAALLSPPIFSIEPGRTQTIRVGLLAPESSASETQYRVVIDRVPSGDPLPGVIVMVLHLSLPVFVPAASEVAPTLEWSARRVDAHHVAVTAVNHGAMHVQIISLTTSTDVAGAKTLTNQMAYVLPGSQRTWNIPVSADASLVRVDAASDAGTLRASARIGP